MSILIVYPLIILASYRVLFEDFEDGNSQHYLGGFWYTYNDRIDAGENKAYSQISPLPFYPQQSGFNSSRFSGHIIFDVTGSDAPFPYASFACSIVNDDVNAYADLSEYTGIGFWIKGNNTSSIPIRFSYNNYPGLDPSIENGGITPRQTALSGISTNWQFHVVAFMQFKVEDWIRDDENFDGIDENGNILFDPYATEKLWDKIQSFAFYLQAPQVIKGEFWVDDISLVKAPLSEMNIDSDGDGYNNYVEYAAGTDIHDSSIYPDERVLKDVNKNGILDGQEKYFIKDIRFTSNPMSIDLGTDIIVSLSKIVDSIYLKMTIEIFNSLGAKINSYSSTLLNQDELIYHWNGRDGDNKKVKPGLYLIRVKISDENSYELMYRTVIVK